MRYIVYFFILTILSSLFMACSTHNGQAIREEYNRGIFEDCLFNPVGFTNDKQPIFLSEDTCKNTLKKTIDEKFYENNSQPSSLSDSYYLGIFDGCRFNPIGVDQNDEFIFHSDEYCAKWLTIVKKLKLFEQNITKNNEYKIPDSLLTPIPELQG